MPNNPEETQQSPEPTKIGLSDDVSREKLDRKVSVAPMMDWTDRHCRYFLRGFSPRVLLYTEMITAAAIVRGDRERLLRHSPEEHPLALQLGGSDPELLAQRCRGRGADAATTKSTSTAAVRATGCARGVRRLPDAASRNGWPTAWRPCAARCAIPVTVKMRIGVVAGAGRACRSVAALRRGRTTSALRHFTATGARRRAATRFIVHARKAVLGGLSPRENREVPPLRFDVVQRLKREFPRLSIDRQRRPAHGGGVRSDALRWSDGVMLGREAYHRPMRARASCSRRLFDDGWRCPAAGAQCSSAWPRTLSAKSRRASVCRTITRHMLGLCAGQPGARRYRRWLSQGAHELAPMALDAGTAARLLRDAAALCAA